MVDFFLLLPESKPSNQWMAPTDPFLGEANIAGYIEDLQKLLRTVSLENVGGFYDSSNIQNFLADFQTLEDYYPLPITRVIRQTLKNYNNWRDGIHQSGTKAYSIYKQPIDNHSFCEVAERKDAAKGATIIIINHDAHILPDSFTLTIDKTNVTIESCKDKNALRDWFADNRIPKRQFHISPKHKENNEQTKVIDNKEVSPLRCSEAEAQVLLNKAIGVNSRELYNFDIDRNCYIVFKWEGPTPQNQYHGYHVEIESSEVPPAIKQQLRSS